MTLKKTIEFLDWIQKERIVPHKKKKGFWLRPGYPQYWELTNKALIKLFNKQNTQQNEKIIKIECNIINIRSYKSNKLSKRVSG